MLIITGFIIYKHAKDLIADISIEIIRDIVKWMKRDLLTNKQNCEAPLCGKFWVGKGGYTMIFPGAKCHT